MMQRLSFVVALALAVISSGSAECANGGNGHGKCTSYDMCICNRNWQASDCSESKLLEYIFVPVKLTNIIRGVVLFRLLFFFTPEE